MINGFVWVSSVQGKHMQHIQLSTLTEPLAWSPSSHMSQALISDSSVDHEHGSETMISHTTAAAEIMGLDIASPLTAVPALRSLILAPHLIELFLVATPLCPIRLWSAKQEALWTHYHSTWAPLCLQLVPLPLLHLLLAMISGLVGPSQDGWINDRVGTPPLVTGCWRRL